MGVPPAGNLLTLRIEPGPPATEKAVKHTISIGNTQKKYSKTQEHLMFCFMFLFLLILFALSIAFSLAGGPGSNLETLCSYEHGTTLSEEGAIIDLATRLTPQLFAPLELIVAA